MGKSNKGDIWLKGPVTDLVIGCGAWSLPLIAIALYFTKTHYGVMALGFYFLALFCNNPHYMATLYRAYGLKRDLNRYKFFSIYITAIIVLSGIAAHISPKVVPLLFTIYLVWSPWHYTGQNFGISLMMLRRAGAIPTKLERNLLYLSYIGSYLVWVVELDGVAAQDAMTLTLGIPETLANSLGFAGQLVFALCGGASLVSLSRRASFKTLIAPITLHLSQFLWFIAPGLLRAFYSHDYPATYFNAGILAFMHCAQYLWVTSYFAKRETEQGLRGERRQWSPWKYFALLTLGGIALFVPGPWIVSIVFRHDLFESLLIFIALVNIHHFMLDGAIWKLREGRIARLLLGAHPPVHKTDSPKQEDGPPETAKWFFSAAPAARITRYAATVLLIGIAAIDQLQNVFTARGASQDRVEVARSLNPNDSRVYFRSALNRLSDGQQETGVKELENALQLNPRNLAALHALAQQRLRSNQIEKAQQLYRRILDIFPKDLSALNNAALIAMHQENWQAALMHLEKSEAIDQDRWQTRSFIGQCLTQLGKFEEATEALESCLPFVDKAPGPNRQAQLRMILPSLATCYEQTGRREEAAALKALL